MKSKCQHFTHCAMYCSSTSGRQEVCLMEQFEARCPGNEVILVQSARYGRMRIGRCVKTDFGYVGCSADVLDLAAQRCSGRRSCIIRVPDPMFEDTKPCNDEFKSYLETTYGCVAGNIMLISMI